MIPLHLDPLSKDKANKMSFPVYDNITDDQLEECFMRVFELQDSEKMIMFNMIIRTSSRALYCVDLVDKLIDSGIFHRKERRSLMRMLYHVEKESEPEVIALEHEETTNDLNIEIPIENNENKKMEVVDIEVQLKEKQFEQIKTAIQNNENKRMEDAERETVDAVWYGYRTASTVPNTGISRLDYIPVTVIPNPEYDSEWVTAIVEEQEAEQGCTMHQLWLEHVKEQRNKQLFSVLPNYVKPPHPSVDLDLCLKQVLGIAARTPNKRTNFPDFEGLFNNFDESNQSFEVHSGHDNVDVGDRINSHPNISDPGVPRAPAQPVDDPPSSQLPPLNHGRSGWKVWEEKAHEVLVSMEGKEYRISDVVHAIIVWVFYNTLSKIIAKSIYMIMYFLCVEQAPKLTYNACRSVTRTGFNYGRASFDYCFGSLPRKFLGAWSKWTNIVATIAKWKFNDFDYRLFTTVKSLVHFLYNLYKGDMWESAAWGSQLVCDNVQNILAIVPNFSKMREVPTATSVNIQVGAVPISVTPTEFTQIVAEADADEDAQFPESGQPHLFTFNKEKWIGDLADFMKIPGLATKDIQHLNQQFTLLKNVKSSVGEIMNLFTSVLSAISRSVFGIDPLDPDYISFNGRLIDIIKFTQMAVVAPDDHFKEKSALRVITDLYRDAISMSIHPRMVTVNKNLGSMYMNHLTLLRDLCAKANRIDAGSNTRIPPFCVLWTGPPEVGKSSCIEMFMQSSAWREFKKKFEGTMRYDVCYDSDYWEGFIKPIFVVINDIWKSKDINDIRRQTMIIQAAVDSAQYVLNTAFDDKGSKRFEAEYLLLTTNYILDAFDLTSLPLGVANNAAIARRLHMVVNRQDKCLSDPEKNTYRIDKCPLKAYEGRILDSVSLCKLIMKCRKLQKESFRETVLTETRVDELFGEDSEELAPANTFLPVLTLHMDNDSIVAPTVPKPSPAIDYTVPEEFNMEKSVWDTFFLAQTRVVEANGFLNPRYKGWTKWNAESLVTEMVHLGVYDWLKPEYYSYYAALLAFIGVAAYAPTLYNLARIISVEKDESSLEIVPSGLDIIETHNSQGSYSVGGRSVAASESSTVSGNDAKHRRKQAIRETSSKVRYVKPKLGAGTMYHANHGHDGKDNLAFQSALRTLAKGVVYLGARTPDMKADEYSVAVGTYLDKGVFVTVAHWFRNFHDKKDVQMFIFDGKNMVLLPFPSLDDTRHILSEEDDLVDVVFFRTDIRKLELKPLASYYVDLENASALLPMQRLTMITVRRLTGHVFKECVKAPTSAPFTYRAADQVFFMETPISYYSQGVEGDSGGPVIAEGPGGRPEIVGMHVGRSTTLTVALPLTKQWIYDILSDYPEVISGVARSKSVVIASSHDTSLLEDISPLAVHNATTNISSQMFPDFPLEIKEIVPIKDAYFPATKSRLQQSLLYGWCGPPQKVPVHLVTFRNKGGEYVNPFAKALTKMKQRPANEKPLSTSTMAYLKSLYPRPPKAPRLLTYEEAINGVKGGLPPISLANAAGYPYNKAPGVVGKRPYINFDSKMQCLVFHPDFRKELEAKVAQLQVGIMFRVIFCDSLKDETKKVQKVEEGGTRLISSCPLDFLTIGRMYFGDFIDHIQKLASTHPVSVGLNVHSLDWSLLKSAFDDFQVSLVSGDYRNFDGNIPEGPVRMFVDYVNWWYDDGPVNARIRELIIGATIKAEHIVGDIIYQTAHGNPSGQFLTSIMNTFVNIIMIHHVCAIILKLSEDDFIIRAYGDDNLIGFKVPGITWKTIADGLKSEFDMEYTHWSKDAAEGVVDTFKTVSYLSRSFRGFQAPLDLRVVLEIPYWKSAKLDDNISIIDSARAFAFELAHHPEEVFSEYIQKYFAAVFELDPNLHKAVQSVVKSYSMYQREKYFMGEKSLECALDAYTSDFYDQMDAKRSRSDISELERSGCDFQVHCGIQKVYHNGMRGYSVRPVVYREPPPVIHALPDRQHMIVMHTHQFKTGFFVGKIIAGVMHIVILFLAVMAISKFSEFATYRLFEPLGRTLNNTFQVHSGIARIADLNITDTRNTEFTERAENDPPPTQYVQLGEYHDVGPVSSTAVDKVIIPGPQQGFNMEIFDLNGAISREYLMGTVAWASSAPTNTVLYTGSFPDDIFTLAYIANKIQDFHFFRAGLRITFRVVANKFLYGTCICVYTPLPSMEYKPSTNAGNASGGPHVRISASSGDIVTMDIPFISRYRMLDIQNHLADEMGNIKIWVVNPVTDVNGDTADASIMITAQFIDVELMVPIGVAPAMTYTAEPDERFVVHSGRGEIRAKSNSHSISSATESKSTGLSLMKAVTLGANYADSFIRGAGKVAAVASVIGLSKPSTLACTDIVRLQPASDISYGKGIDVGNKLAMDPENMISTTPNVAGISVDEMALKKLIGTPQLVSQWTFINSTPPAAIVKANPYDAAPCIVDQVSKFFHYSRGSYKVKVYFTASLFHTVKGVLWFADSLDTASYWNACYHKVIDIQGDTSVEFTIPYASKYLSESDDAASGWGVYFQIISWSVPVPSVAPPIYLNVYKAAADDFELGGLMDVTFQPSSGVEHIADFEVHNNPREDFSKPFPMFQDSMTGYQTDGFILGEKYTSVREIVHRYSAYYATTADQPVYNFGVVATGRFIGFEMWSLFYRFWRGSVRYKFFSPDYRYVSSVFMWDSDTNKYYPGTYISSPSNPVIECEAPYYSKYVMHNVGTISGLRVGSYTSTNGDASVVPKFLFKSAGDDMSFHFIRALPLGTIVPNSTGGNSGTAAFSSYLSTFGTPYKVTQVP